MPMENPPPGKHGTGPTFPPPDPNAPQPADAPVTPLSPAQTQQYEQRAGREGFIKRFFISIDDVGNVVVLNGLNDETMSSDFARMAIEDEGLKRDIGSVASRILDLFQKDHGAKAVAGDTERAAEVTAVEDASGLAQ